MDMHTAIHIELGSQLDKSENFTQDVLGIRLVINSFISIHSNQDVPYLGSHTASMMQ